MNTQLSGFRSQVSSPPISCLILTYNEASRIRPALTHALQWADDVVVLDKSSTDNTRELAAAMGARVVTVPFSKAGHEDVAALNAHAAHDWVWGFTPGEIPTKACIEKGRSMIGDHVDVVAVPMHYFSFGIHHAASPWHGGWQPRLYHRHRVHYTGIVHDPIHPHRPAWVMPRAPDCYVLHQTHATPESFIRSHTDYALNEAAHDLPERMVERALHNAQAFDRVFESNPELLPQQIGWKIYWLMTALNAWGRAAGEIPAQYQARAQQMLAEQWSATPKPLAPSQSPLARAEGAPLTGAPSA